MENVDKLAVLVTSGDIEQLQLFGISALSNSTGRKQADAVNFPCRYHIFEVVLRSMFDTKIPSSSIPNVPLFKRLCLERLFNTLQTTY